MRELIERQAAIDAIHCNIVVTGRENAELVAKTMGEFVDRIKALPTIQPEPQWIPVSERLPETTDPVLTTYIVNGDRSRKYVEESAYYENDEYWCSPWDEYRKEGTRIEVIAWMPEPEPYKPNK